MVGQFFKRKPKSDPEATGPIPDFEATAPALYEHELAAFEDTTPDALPGVPDLYAVMGLDARASDDAIRYAYRRRAARLLDARWRPGRAARRLAELNAAYEILGKPDRRADYDRQRMRQAVYERARIAESRVEQIQTASYSSVGSVPDADAHEFPTEGTFRDGAIHPVVPHPPGTNHGSTDNGGSPLVDDDGAATVVRPVQSAARRGPRLGRPGAAREIVMLAIAAALVVAVVAGLVRAVSAVDVAAWTGPGWGGSANPSRAEATMTAPPALTPTPRPVLVQQPTSPTSTPVQPTATLPPRPTVAAKPNSRPALGPGAIGTQVRITDQNPPRGSDVGVTVRVTRDGRPLANVPVALRVYYETVEERWPPGDETVATNASGEATIVFNIGDASPGYEAQVVAVADVGGDPYELQTSFVPR